MNIQWLNIVGLIFDIIGSVFLSYGLIINKKDAIELGVSRVSGNKDEDNLKLPQIQDRLKQSKNATIGLIFLIIGFVLQIVTSWANVIRYNEKGIFLIIVIILVIIIFYQNIKRNAWDIMFFNTTLAIVILFMIGLLAENLWDKIVYTLGLVALGSGIAGIFKTRK